VQVGNTTIRLSQPLSIPSAALADDNVQGGVHYYHLVAPALNPGVLTAQVAASQAADANLLGWIDLSVHGAVSGTLTINLPPAQQPVFSLTVSGQTSAAIAPIFGGAAGITFTFAINTIQASSIPSLQITFPSLSLSLPPFSLPQIPDFLASITAGIATLGSEAAGTVKVSWQDITFQQATPRVEITHLRVESPLLPEYALDADVTLAFRPAQSGNGYELDPTNSSMRRYEPDADHLVTITLQDLLVSPGCFLIRWGEPKIDAEIEKLGLGISWESDPAITPMAVRVLKVNGGAEIRFEWQPQAPALKMALPGASAEFTSADTSNTFFTLIASVSKATVQTASLIATFPAGSSITASTDLGWLRGELERELIPPVGSQNPLFSITLTREASPASLLLVSVKPNGGNAPKFLQKLNTLVPSVVIGQATHSCQAVDLNGDNLAHVGAHPEPAGEWTLGVSFAQEELMLPILNVPSPADLFQAIKIRKATSVFANSQLNITLWLNVSIGPQSSSLSLDVQLDATFDFSTLSLEVDHQTGLTLYSSASQLTPGSLLNLSWTFEGAPQLASDGSARYAYFVLATDNYHYTLQQAKGCKLTVELSGLGQDKIDFNITNFALTPKGINLDATVVAKPVLINGLNTRFTFTNSQFSIREGHIADFVLSGSGPLPPDLVGSASADVYLHFSQQQNGLTLVSAGANLKGNKPLECRLTRFQFKITAIGLKFVLDNQYHLYFTLSGSAKFVLADGDDASGPLAWLPAIEIDLMNCPLAGDMRVLARHIDFLVPLPRHFSFSFFGCFTMEIRAIAFLAAFDPFDGDASMEVSGQIYFAEGAGDNPHPDIDFHKLYIGLPGPGDIFPRIYLNDLPIDLSLGDAFKLSGSVEFLNNDDIKGFQGEGVLQIQGLPTFAASFSFVRVRRDSDGAWLRAWFIYLEVRGISIPIPVVEIYIREVGLGFGYRYTLASIALADNTTDVKQLVQQLGALSLTQGDLAHVQSWKPDMEKAGESPRWTVVLRALISEYSAAHSLLDGAASYDQNLPCLFLADTVIALRSDLTFYMAGRVWLFTNYYDYATQPGIQPFMSAFVLLSPRQRMLLAHMQTNPNATIGGSPQLPQFVKDALTSCQFSATLLMRPGLLHYEMGWPSSLRWTMNIGPLSAEFRGGIIYRLSTQEYVQGMSFTARARLEIRAEVDFGFIGARVWAVASVGFGGRYIGVLDLKEPLQRSAFYAALGLEINVEIGIEFWLHISLGFFSIDLDFGFSIAIGFTASLELGLMGLASLPGIRGAGRFSISVMGHGLTLSVHFAANEDSVQKALDTTKNFLTMGLDSNDVDQLPGLPSPGPSASRPLNAAQFKSLPSDRTGRVNGFAQPLGVRPSALPSAANTPTLKTPDYSLFVIQQPGSSIGYFVLFPQGQNPDQPYNKSNRETGFLPPPPPSSDIPPAGTACQIQDFQFNFGRLPDGFTLKQITYVNNGNPNPWTYIVAPLEA
jgi:hypothetical protein